MPTAASNLLVHKSISRWDEAIPLGNGLCGALIWGKSTALRFSLDRGDVWDTTPFAGGSSEEYTYAAMVRLAKEGNADEIRRIFDAPYNHSLPTKLPAGKLILDFHCDANVCSALDLATATATLQVKDIQIKSYLHATDKCGFVWVNKPLSAFSYRIENPAYGASAEGADGNAALNSS
ncbi:MAG: glycoside hydrolase N-terminal domain-containing protein, partial [Clostridia bacterium]